MKQRSVQRVDRVALATPTVRAGQVIKSEAAEHLVGVIARHVPGKDSATPDLFDPRGGLKSTIRWAVPGS